MRPIDADELVMLHPEIADLLNEAPTLDAVVLPFRPGDSVWYIDTEDGYRIKKYDEPIYGVAYYGDGKFEAISEDGERSDVGKSYCCISIEQAEEVRRIMLSLLTMKDIDHTVRYGRKYSPTEWEPFWQEIKDLFLKKVESLV